MSEESHTPDPVDIHVGTRLRAQRKRLNMSQENLGHALGITFQQIQKYERGTNRISASMMYRAAAKLNVGPAYFFEGLPENGSVVDLAHAQTDATLRRAYDLVPAIVRIPELTLAARRGLGKVIEAMAEPTPAAAADDSQAA